MLPAGQDFQLQKSISEIRSGWQTEFETAPTVYFCHGKLLRLNVCPWRRMGDLQEVKYQFSGLKVFLSIPPWNAGGWRTSASKKPSCLQRCCSRCLISCLQNSPLFQCLQDLGYTDFEACPTASQQEECGGQEEDFISAGEDTQGASVSLLRTDIIVGKQTWAFSYRILFSAPDSQ